MEVVLDEGKLLYGDNYHTSLPLVQKLLEKTFYCRTVKETENNS